MIEHRGRVEGGGRRVAIAVARFNEVVTRELLDGAREGLLSHGVREDAIEVAWVPGAWEIPAALTRMAASGRFDALVALGCVIRGETPHFEYVSGGVARGVADVGARTGLPVIFGVLTTEDLEQAMARAGGRAGNKGYEAALAALEMISLLESLAAGGGIEGA